MSNWATLAIIAILCVGLLCLIALMGVAIAETIQDMKRKKKEWEREDDLRGWGRRR